MNQALSQTFIESLVHCVFFVLCIAPNIVVFFILFLYIDLLHILTLGPMESTNANLI